MFRGFFIFTNLQKGDVKNAFNYCRKTLGFPQYCVRTRRNTKARRLYRRKGVLKELELYYSIDEITKRAQNAGFGDDPALLEKIIEAQYNYGQGVINAQKINQGYFNADKGLEQSLANYLTDKWRFNTVFEIFGFTNTYEDRKALADSVAKAALTGSDIKIGDFTMSYKQFLSIEKTMTSVYSSLSAKFTVKSPVTLDSLQRKVNQEGLKYADKRISDALNNWFDDMVTVYNHIWDLKATNMKNAYWNIVPWNGDDTVNIY